jgi:hypothetical protein
MAFEDLARLFLEEKLELGFSFIDSSIADY